MTQVIKVSKGGENVLTATDPNDFIFDSTLNTFKILATGTLTSQTVDADPKTFSVTHGIGGLVAVYAFAKFPDGYVALPSESEKANHYSRYWFVEVTSTTIYFIFYKGSTANYNIDIKWYAFEVPGS